MLLLDNMDPGLVRETLRLLGEAGLPQIPIVEVSGGITAENICEFAIGGVSVISIGALTHSVSNLDIGLDVSAVMRS